MICRIAKCASTIYLNYRKQSSTPIMPNESSLPPAVHPHLMRRVLASWPYVFIAISVTGLGYIAINALR